MVIVGSIMTKDGMFQLNENNRWNPPPSPIYGLKIICRIPRTINNNHPVSSIEINPERTSPSRNQSTFDPLILGIIEPLNQPLPFRALCSSI
jgi:hypothetical protein